MTFKLEIHCDNAAFGDAALERCMEVARILRALSYDMLAKDDAGRLRDRNGNTVGEWSFSTEEATR